MSQVEVLRAARAPAIAARMKPQLAWLSAFVMPHCVGVFVPSSWSGATPALATSRLTLGLCMLFGLGLGACGAEFPGGDDIAEFDRQQQGLNIVSDQIWTSLTIPVCWENPKDASATRRGWVQKQITNTWQKYSQVEFTGWGTCKSSSKGIRIRIADEVATTGTRLGKALDGVKNGVTLNLSMDAPPSYADCGALFGDQACVRSTATHEFGHALGFAHEQMRRDNPDFDCFDLIGGQLGDTFVGGYDKSSIMRSCTVRDSAKRSLSSTDKLGLAAYYGTPSKEKIPQDSIVWNDDYVIFFFGGNMTRYSFFLDQAESYFPSPIKGIAKRWPSSGPWVNGVSAALNFTDEKVYLFSGSQYARMDRDFFSIDSGYPRSLPGGWRNWPSDWDSVDAAVKWANGKQYLFRGDEYLRLTGTRVDDGYPKPIAGHWNIPYGSGFDHAHVHNNGKAYFFKGDEYIRVTISGSTEKVDPGYPKKIVGRWPGVPF